jgi:hypothetical protein
MKIQFSVSLAAKGYIREHWQNTDDSEPMLVTLGGYLDQQPPNLDGATPINEVIEHGRKFLESVKRPMFQWIVEAADKNGVAPAHIHTVDGILFALTEETITLIGDRELILDNGRLRFEPDLDRFEYKIK